ncbi:aldo/keto reductase [Mesoflavibacter zeaxanthinifaciens]|uniref:aldo/keto reductase n=1 Tax=Mesoflavibacter zeaxanthinifaciens TaxID=393060 RepID=UPI000400C358|nr:aldo/keto reductase [Mesoflavibacter zeaxanthinifaciens]
MKTLQFRNNDEIPILGLGTFRSEPNEVYTSVYEAIKIGYRHIDCASVYGNEKEVGNAIADAIKEGIVTREDLWITSKLWSDSHGRENVIPALQNTLNDLQLEYLDLYLIHWPVAFKKGVEFPKTAEEFIPLEDKPLTDTWKGMEDALEQGLTKHIGMSNFNQNDLINIIDHAKHLPEMLQVEVHPFLQQNELLEFAKTHRIHMTAYAPIGSGANDDDELILLKNKTINDIATANNMTAAQVLLAWDIQRGVSVIPKSVNPKRLQENFDTIHFELKEDDMKRIEALDKNHRFIDGTFWEVENGPYTADSIWNA